MKAEKCLWCRKAADGAGGYCSEQCVEAQLAQQDRNEALDRYWTLRAEGHAYEQDDARGGA